MTDREIMQMVIDAWGKLDLADLSKAVTAIRERLAQPERVDEKAKDSHEDWCASLTQLLLSNPPQPAPCDCKPLKRKWVGLTDEERHQISLDNRPYCANIMRAHEEELKRRNT
jgi:hypothetical protein